MYETCPWQITWSKILNLSHESPQKRLLLQKMVRHPTCMILSNKLGHNEDGWRDALCTPVLLGLLQGRLPRRLCPGRRARLQKFQCSLLVETQTKMIITKNYAPLGAFSIIQLDRTVLMLHSPWKDRSSLIFQMLQSGKCFLIFFNQHRNKNYLHQIFSSKK